MVNITHKNSTLRKALAEAVLSVSSQDTIDAIVNNKVPKGNVFEMSKTAGLFAAKKTSDIIPDCHPLPIEYTSIQFEIRDLDIYITSEIHTIYKTGVEVEAMHSASVVALTMYDMLKPIDKSIEIRNIRLIEKKGGKSDHKDSGQGIDASVIVCSDSIFAGKKEDKAGKAIISSLENNNVKINDYVIIPDEVLEIQNKIKSDIENGIDLIMITGGTGLSKRDVTPEAVRPLLDREIPGVAEAIRSYGQLRTPYSMLSRSLAGMIGDTLIIALPGSTKGAEESMDAIFPGILHIYKILNGGKH
ncbi:bifunctional molybdenum cofactor biosynthesis protein MoaC/MoaB [Chryseobacterium sp. Ch-15]|uniref:Molybdopterin adenylyltransferase n=1 Tax=Chryseobacterium muglaense TaxID=2893752 RepID=A0A9Q3YPS9_9FLAO|nr:bifunctional molybdenum cofactor biosynthesis protein MoaC/MoaB [Chryseobacterium muglaense]MBD3906317.1 bifunctional molybdenum cofactor biosynthesis protein MoaC/MoaB [Chryseobacterium muglaense]MCC9033084.1 bifunctional molybdenum cofactor biosynthesis protein MoaC/MoaB [Chryseobacterium muglaense]MCM2556015.1 bifunctional molybdenum cofactor biosynthesis protein MoaC/MoaB [Chryseobacterium muglaense]